MQLIRHKYCSVKQPCSSPLTKLAMSVCYPHFFHLSVRFLTERYVSKMEGENGALLHRRVVKVHGHWLKGGRVLFLVCKGGQWSVQKQAVAVPKVLWQRAFMGGEGWGSNLPGRACREWPPALSTDIWRTAKEDHGLWLDAQTEPQKVQGLSPWCKECFYLLESLFMVFSAIKFAYSDNSRALCILKSRNLVFQGLLGGHAWLSTTLAVFSTTTQTFFFVGSIWSFWVSIGCDYNCLTHLHQLARA